METTGKFQTFDLKLKALGPVFIGDGTKTGKKEYLHDRQRGLASFFDGEKFFRLLLEKGLEDKYEAFMYGGQGDLHAFLTCGCGLREEDWAPALRCSLKIGDDLDAARSANDIFGFVRDAGSRAYIPGSSVKGALGAATTTDLKRRREKGLGVFTQRQERTHTRRAVSAPP